MMADRHFHSTHDAIYVSTLHPETGALMLRCYLVKPGGELEEFDYTQHRPDGEH